MTRARGTLTSTADPATDEVAALVHDPARALLTSTYVFDELVTLVQARLGLDKAVQAGRVLRKADGVAIERITQADETSAWFLFQDRVDKTYSFTDCTSFVLMQRLGVDAALATDEHFHQEGFRVYP
ncbi:MAG: type II toxin-antitoxin system VapC family toxin [Salinibacter sp.]